MASTNPYGGGGGIGGKMRRRPTRSSQSTPYDRPPATPRTPAVVPPAIDSSNGWLSKIMDPASRLLSGSASKIFSSVFRKSLPAPPQVPPSSSSPSREEMHQEGEEEPVPQLTTAETPAERELAETPVERELAEIPDEIKSFSEIEQLLVQKTFTKEQFEHLTELLRARVVEPRLSEQAQIGEGKEAEANIPHREYVAENSRKNVMFATPASTLLIPKDEIASPMEVAKAYMSSKSSKVSPTTLRLRTPAFVERKPALPNSTMLHASMKPPTGVATPRPGSLLFDQVKDAYPTPRSLGRTAISRMCCSPFVKSGGLSSSGTATKFSPYDAPRGSTPGSKLALKRGSSAPYDEIGSVGPIRRIRQKLNMTTPKESAPSPYKNFAPTHTSALRIDKNDASATMQKYLQLKQNMEHGTGNGETEPDNIRIPRVPPRSTETAMKILDQLEKIAQSPKDKKSQNTVLEIEASSSQKQDKPKVDLPKLTRYDEKISGQGNVVGMIGSGTGAKTSKSVSVGTSSSVTVSKSTKPSFRMSVSEEFLDDDDEEANDKKVEATVPVKNVFNKVESGTSMQGKVESKIPEEKATSASEAKAEPAPTTKPDESILSAAPVSETNGALKFTSLTTPPIKFDFPSVPVSSTASLDLFANKDEKCPSPIFSTGLKQRDKPETPVFPWATENIGAKTDSGFPTTEALDSDIRGQKRKSEDAGKLTESSAFSTSPSLATQVPVKPSFSFGGSATPDLSNGSVHSSPTFSFSAVPAGTSATQPAVASSTAAFSITASPNDSSAAVEIPKASFVQFGASNAASSQALAFPLLDDSRTKASNTSTVKPFAFGSSPSFSTAGATAPSTLTTSTMTTDLFSSNVAGQSTSVTLNTPTFAFGNSEKTTTSPAPTFAFGSSATAVTTIPSSPSVALGTSAATEPVSTSSTANESTTATTPTVSFGSSGTTGAFTFSASSQPANSSSQATPFAFGAVASSSNSGTSIFGFGASNQNTSSSASMPSSGSSQSTFGFGASSGSVFSTKPAQPESVGTQSYLQQSQSVNSQFSSPFSSAASSPVIFGASSGGFCFTSTASSSSSIPASTSQSSMFGSGSTGTPSVFGTTTFGSNASGSTFTLGQSSSTVSTSFAFGGQSSSPGFSYTASNSSTAPSFGLSNHNTNSSTLFGSVSPGSNNDQMSMEDSMVDDTNQVATANPPVPVFGQAASPVPLFGAPSGSAPAPAFQFGAQPSQSLFQPGSNLEFNAGNQVSGSGASDKANRRIVKVRNKMRRK